MAQSSTLYSGLDVQTASIAVAYAAQDDGADVVDLGSIGPRQCDLAQRVRQLPSTATRLVLVDEAGPCGSWLSRSLTHKGSDGGVVAPSLLPKKAGDRGKPARRDALQLARLMRAGDRTPVSVPQVDEEAMRALGRARAEVLRALTAATWRLTACVRRHDLRAPGPAPWPAAHRRWRSAGVCPPPAQHSGCPA